jgi:formylglycine-generating enzyme required for sulfatase activity
MVRLLLVALAFFAVVAGSRAQSINVPLSPVGNAANAPDPATGYGQVGYAYSIGAYDITNSQYCAFLNAVATNVDTYQLYNQAMAGAGSLNFNSNAGILQTGTTGSFAYSVMGSSGNDPITYVSWLDAARFCNWMQNGQPATGVENTTTTEEGAYTLDGDMDTAYSNSFKVTGTTGQETRNPGATWWIPSENEWYKAAYYDPALNSGSGGYWLYATQSNTTPGNVVGSASNQANYLYFNGINYLYSQTQGAAYSASEQDYLTPVGAFTNSRSYYGTYDQSGDVFQWNEAIVQVNSRGLRGGGWYGNLPILQSGGRTFGGPAGSGYDIGFRIASSLTPPTILSAGVASISGSAVILTGTVNPNGQSNTAYFLYGLSSNYTSQSAVQVIGNGNSNVVISATLTGLVGQTIYHYALVAAGAPGTAAQTPDATFVSGPVCHVTLSTIGNPGNTPDPLTGHGEVDYSYNIGTYDITESQYCTFLNAVATGSDPYGLYNPNFLETNGTFGGILQNGTLGSYSYSIMGSTGNDPVTYVTWLDAARFCNWLQNGQPDTGSETAASTEQGAYTLNGDIAAGLETRNPAATWWIPSQDQWYKAAYYDPALNSGSGGYWTYPTQSDISPGNAIGSAPNQADYYTSGGYSVTQADTYQPAQNYLTPVGSFTNSQSYFGTYDQGGDVNQWNDAIVAGSYRGLRGGSWATDGPNAMQSTTGLRAAPASANGGIGFRVANGAPPLVVPTILSSGVLSVTGSGALLTATVNPNGADTMVYFQYGTTPAYGSQSTPQDIGSAFDQIIASGSIGGLSPLTPYYYQAVAINTTGTSLGAAASFNTTPPIASVDYVTLTGASTIVIRPLLSDTDPNGFPLTITAVSQPSLGNAVITGMGTAIAYTPNFNFINFAGTDIFNYTISNGNGGTATAEIIVGNPYYLQKGNFCGTLNNPGGGYITLTVSAGGAFTGKLRTGTRTYVLKGTFNSAGSYSTTLGGEPLTLQFDTAGLTGDPFGQYNITGTYNGVAFTTWHALYNSVSNPAPEAGYYTVLLPANSLTNSSVPTGTGYAIISVSEDGNVSITGYLADGSAFSDGIFITGGTDAFTDSFPIYSVLGYKIPGSLTGSLTFEDIPAVSGTGGSDCDGTFTWVKPVQPYGDLYPIGFTTTLAAAGSRYQEPPLGTLALTLSNSDPNANISLTEPDFAGPYNHQLYITSSSRASTDTVVVTNTSSDSLKLSINAASGIFTGTFIDPISAERVEVSGLILFKQTEAAGFFLSPTQSGNVIITP